MKSMSSVVGLMNRKQSLYFHRPKKTRTGGYFFRNSDSQTVPFVKLPDRTEDLVLPRFPVSAPFTTLFISTFRNGG